MDDKLFASVDTFELFKTLKVSDNENNESYKIGGEGESISGIPQILYDQIVFIEDISKIYRNGIFYDNPEEQSIGTFKINDTIYAEDSYYENSMITFGKNIKYDKETDTIIFN